jgi:hypothetical protein
MKFELSGWPYVTVTTIPSSKETHQFFLLPGLLIGRGYFSIFWFQKMMTINFNTKLVYDDEDLSESETEN